MVPAIRTGKKLNLPSYSSRVKNPGLERVPMAGSDQEKKLRLDKF